MRIFMIILLLAGVGFAGFKLIETIKFDTTISISVIKGPFKGMDFQLVDYKVSLNDLKQKDDFWESPAGKEIMRKLSTTLQTVIHSGTEYVSIYLDVNFFGLMHKRYTIISQDKGFHTSFL